jgi:RNA polymerase sigma factor (sigma-70 family)
METFRSAGFRWGAEYSRADAAEPEPVMDSEALKQRLSCISTAWSLVVQAHTGHVDAATSAQNALMERYGGAVFRYLLGALRDPDAAADLSQDFALRFVRGDFRRADPERGRFRDYVRVSLSRMVSEYFRSRKRQPVALSPDAPDPSVYDSVPDSDQVFIASWREELLERTWQALSEANAAYHTVLLHRIDNPDAASGAMAGQLTLRLGKTVNAAWVRKTLQRAHEKFADLLLEEVARSLGASETEAVRAELEELDLLKYCRSALERRQ